MSDDTTKGSGVYYWGNSGTGVMVNATLADGQQRHLHVERGGELPGMVGDTDPRPVSVRTIEGLLATADWSREATFDAHEASIVATREAAEVVALSDVEAGEIAAAVDAGAILSDDDFAKWLADTSAADVVTAVGDDVVLGKRALLAEQARGDDARKGLVGSLVKITTETE